MILYARNGNLNKSLIALRETNVATRNPAERMNAHERLMLVATVTTAKCWLIRILRLSHSPTTRRVRA